MYCYKNAENRYFTIYLRYRYRYSTWISEHDLDINRPMFVFVKREKSLSWGIAKAKLCA